MGFYNTENWPEKKNYYRWPWSNNDNPVAWLEITDLCNIHCKGCYRSTMTGHRDLAVLKGEVDFFIKVRNIDTVCIAGGEPLIYPHIVELVRYIADQGVKPNIITNCHALTEELLTELKDAGVFGLTCHVDMIQERPERKEGDTELDLLALRQKIADLIYKVGKGKIVCTFNTTVYHENFKYLPDIVRWARKNVQKVSGLDFITYRGIPIKEGYTFDAEEALEGGGTEKIKDKLGYVESAEEVDITAVDVYNLLKDNFGRTFEPCAYLGGTGHIMDYKWWGEACLMEKKGPVYGSIGPRTMEFLQIIHHWFKKRYFMYLGANRVPRILIQLTFLLGDKKLRRARRRMFWRLLNPIKWFQPIYTQSIGINQPPDMMENGMANMCESCPDACVWEGNLVSSCRLDEYRKYGRMLNAISYTDNKQSDKRTKEPVK
jgi:MoaA/NifB/PqqE/SkfB family radical SAM enzyme